jgi:hypothetical protein
MNPSSSLQSQLVITVRKWQGAVRLKLIYLRLNVHDNQVSFNGALILLVRHAEVSLEVLEELLDVHASNFESFEVSRVAAPDKFEICDIGLEAVENVIVWQVVEVELLKDNQDEQVNHDVLLNEYEGHVKDGCIRGATVEIGDAVLISVHAVIHHVGPVFSR